MVTLAERIITLYLMRIRIILIVNLNIFVLICKFKPKYVLFERIVLNKAQYVFQGLIYSCSR